MRPEWPSFKNRRPNPLKSSGANGLPLNAPVEETQFVEFSPGGRRRQMRTSKFGSRRLPGLDRIFCCLPDRSRIRDGGRKNEFPHCKTVRAQLKISAPRSDPTRIWRWVLGASWTSAGAAGKNRPQISQSQGVLAVCRRGTEVTAPLTRKGDALCTKRECPLPQRGNVQRCATGLLSSLWK